MTNPLPAVSAYDPYVGRAVRGVRSALSAGFPVLVRLHAAGAYAGPSEAATDMLDREGYAVLLTGYDDDAARFSYVDPFTSARADLPFDEFGLRVVDSTLDFTLILSDLQISCTCSDGSTIVRVSQYQPEMPVIDRDSCGLENLVLSDESGHRIVATPQPDGSFTALIAAEDTGGAWEVVADLVGHRPTSYRRRICAKVPIPLVTA